MWQKELRAYKPFNEQEQQDKKVLLQCLNTFDNVLTRENSIAHITVSGFVVNKARTKVLMIHHNIYDSWGWTGGHADGETDFLAVAIREVLEETGVASTAVEQDIMSLDLLTVKGHMKKGAWVTPHLHLNVTYLLEADEQAETTIAPEENSGVQWLALDELGQYVNEPDLLIVYNKIIAKMKQHEKSCSKH